MTKRRIDDEIFLLGWGQVIDRSEVPDGIKFLPLPDRETLTDEEKSAFDYIIERDKRKFAGTPEVNRLGFDYAPNTLWTGMLQAPLLAELWANMGNIYMTAEGRGSYTNRDRGLVDMALGLSGGQIKAAVHAGVDPRHIQAIRAGRYEELDPADRQIVEYTLAVRDRKVNREMFEALVERMGMRTAVELTLFIPYKMALYPLSFGMYLIQGIPMQTIDDDKLLDELIAGTVEAHGTYNDSVFAEKKTA